MDRVLKAARTSGALNLSNRSLSEVPTEVYQNFDNAGEGGRWWEVVDLQKLILAHNNIEVLKDDLKNLPLLTVLNVSHNKLTQLPAAIGELPSLKSFDVSFNLIANIPEEIGSASSLVKVDCSNNRLLALPNSLGQCMELAELKASNNSIASLPEDLLHCKKLVKVDIEGNKLTTLSDPVIASWTMLSELNACRYFYYPLYLVLLDIYANFMVNVVSVICSNYDSLAAAKNLLTSIPEGIGRLFRLIRLDVHQNRISSLPSSIGGCSSLVEFYVGSNLLTSLPKETGELSQLSILDLRSNQLKEYPAEACRLRLSVLDLSNNALSGLPAEIGLMTSLRKLVLTGNPMRTIRSTLVSGPTPALLKYLRSRLPSAQEAEASTPTKDAMIAMAARLSITSKELSLGGMSLTAVPPEVCTSDEITKVDLSRNSIEELPVALSSRSSLEVFILSRNKIKDWPVEVLKSLANLSCLRLDHNPLRQIPLNGFEAVPKLQILDLSGCVASLPDNPAFASLPLLQELYLRRVQLSEVPADILSLQKLQILDLSQNSLRAIPEGFQNLTSLTELDLQDNSITNLPAELGLLEPSLQALRVDGNPLRSIRRTILDRGTKAILKYLKDKL